jgi:hypothetical protein
MAIPIAPFSFCWPLPPLAETVTSDHASAACYRRPEHVGIAAVVVPELKLGNVERHVFGAHLVKRADHTAFEDGPETFNRVRVNRADDILVLRVHDALTRIFGQTVVYKAFVGRQQANLVRYHFAHEGLRGLFGHTAKDAGDDITLPFNRTNDRSFARAFAARLAVMFLVPVSVCVLAAYPCFVNLYNAAKLLLWRNQGGADFMAHGMGRLVATKAHHALDLEGTHSFLTGEHQMGDPVPVAEGLFGVFENSPAEAREPITLRCTRPALPVKWLVAGGVVQIDVPATRTGDALRPAASDQVAKACLVVPDWETGLKLDRCHLRNWLRTFCHGGCPRNLSVGAYCHAREFLSTGR